MTTMNDDTGIHRGQAARLDAAEPKQGRANGAARLFARSLGALRPLDAGATYKRAIPFGEHPVAKVLNKGRAVLSMFGLANPFYRSHDGRLGALASYQGRQLVNFASYDYLGLNQEPAVAAAAKAAIDACGTS